MHDEAQLSFFEGWKWIQSSLRNIPHAKQLFWYQSKTILLEALLIFLR